MKEVLEILSGCRQKGVSIALDPLGENLKLKGNIKDLTPAERKILQQQKAGIIAFLKQAKQQRPYLNIPRVAEQAHYPLSSVQQRLWALSQFEAGNVAYNLPGACVFNGILNTSCLMAAFDSLIARHEILRTVFREDERGEIRQFILPPGASGFRITCTDLREEGHQEETVRKLVARDFMEPFDLAAGPLIRTGLYQLNNKWVFTYTMHHIISDGWSMDVLLHELLRFYETHLQGKPDPFVPLEVQYKDYAVWQLEQLNSGALKEQGAYWQQQFKEELPVLELAGDKQRPAIKSYSGGIIKSDLSPVLSRALHTFCRAQGATLFMGLVALVNTLLYRYTQQEDIIVGSPVAGREHADLQDQLGCYVNTLALRARFKGSNNFRELLEHIKEVTLAAYAHQLYPFDALLETLQPERNMSRSPLFDVMVALENKDSDPANGVIQLHDLFISPYVADPNPISKFDLSFYFVETGDGVQVNLQYNNDVFTADMATVLSGHLLQLASAIAGDPSVPLNQLDFLSPVEKHRQLSVFNDNSIRYPEQGTVVELFEAQVEKTPGNIALVFGSARFTYRELNEVSNQLAAYLRHRYNIQAGNQVAVKLKRSEGMMIALLGILKSGGAYLPLSPDHPQERIDYMLENSQCKVIIDEQELAHFFREKNNYDTHNLVKQPEAGDLAYVIYTSGSTGKPKGVLIGHDNLASFLQSCKHTFIQHSSI